MVEKKEELSTGQEYARFILDKWKDIYLLSEVCRVLYLKGEYNGDDIKTYIAMMTRLWMELEVKMENRTDMGSLPSEFKRYEIFYTQPDLLLTKDNTREIFGIERMLRKTLEILDITAFEGKVEHK